MFSYFIVYFKLSCVFSYISLSVLLPILGVVLFSGFPEILKFFVIFQEARFGLGIYDFYSG